MVTEVFRWTGFMPPSLKVEAFGQLKLLLFALGRGESFLSFATQLGNFLVGKLGMVYPFPFGLIFGF